VSFKLLLSCSRFATLKYLFLSNSASRDLICAAVNAVRGLFFLSSSLIAAVVLSWTSLSALVVELVPLLLVHASVTMLRVLQAEIPQTTRIYIYIHGSAVIYSLNVSYDQLAAYQNYIDATALMRLQKLQSITDRYSHHVNTFLTSERHRK